MSDGFSLILDRRGRIEQVLEDTRGILDERDKTALFASLLDASSGRKFFQFLTEAISKQAAYGWELNIRAGNHMQTVFLTGILSGGRVLVVGVFSENEINKYLGELASMNSEFSSQLRTLLQDLNIEKREKHQALDELTGMNNQLVNLQRELQLKNNMLDQQSRVLEKLNEDKNRFLGMAAHDLRNPLGVILNLSGILLDEDRRVEPGEIAEFATIINQSSRFMLQMLEDLLDISVIESGNLRLMAGTHNIFDVLQRNVEMNAFLAREKEITLDFQAPCENFPMELDRGKIDQVINNLISNAIKFSERGSSIEITLVIEGKNCIVSVRDYGQGIPQEELEGIFSEFATTSTKSTEGEKSTGLGLMIAHKIMQAHGGTISVRSAPGEGSTFFISLPHGKDLGEQELRQLQEGVPMPETTEKDAIVMDDGNLKPIIVVSTAKEFFAAMEAAFAGRFFMQKFNMAKDFLLNAGDSLNEKTACLDCANLDMPLPVILTLAARKNLGGPRILLCNFEATMLNKQQLEKFNVKQILHPGQSLETLQLEEESE